MKKLKLVILFLCLITLLILTGCSEIQDALESKQDKCEKERGHCKAECGTLSGIFGCSSKCDKHYNACIM